MDALSGTNNNARLKNVTLLNNLPNHDHWNKRQRQKINRPGYAYTRDKQTDKDKRRWQKDFRKESILPYIGFDNSDKNTSRQDIGSCTDMVAVERRTFGPWQVPNADRQRRLVERISSYKLPALPDPRFASWVNHFQHYWDIGVNQKAPQRPVRQSSNTSSSVLGDTSLNIHISKDNQKDEYATSYQRYLRREYTTLERQRRADNDGENVVGNGRRSGQFSSKLRNRDRKLVPGLDRRYMGLQSANKEEIEQTVSRLMRMTSAYNAKFAPNPHVWVDNSPGAHMVIKREKTIK